MTWISRINEWLGWRDAPSDSRSVGSCLEDPEAAKEELKAQQRELGREIETLFRAFDERLQSLSMRAHTLPREEFVRESAHIRAAQDQLRRALRRLDVSVKATDQLERELAEWEAREDGGELHADHPSVRAEIVRSELAVRGRKQDVRRSENDVPVREVVERIKQQIERSPSQEQEDEVYGSPEYVFVTHEPIGQTDPENLVRAIREATREAERWHAVPSEDHNEDALLQMKHLRELHALLKRMDREQGIERDRIELAVSPGGLR